MPCLAVPERSLAIATAADDGSSPALRPAAVTVKSFAGESVGEMRPIFDLDVR